MEKVIIKRNDFMVDALFYFEPVKRFEDMGDMFNFGTFNYCARNRVFQ